MSPIKINTVNAFLMNILQDCMQTQALKDFLLVGGTALALQRGHRISIDIDLFTSLDYGTMPIQDIKSFFYHLNSTNSVEGLNELEKSALGYNLRVKNKENDVLKIDLFYTEKFIFPIKLSNNIRMADEREIAAMKMLAIGIKANRIKDYWDIHDLLEDYTITDMIRWGYERNSYTITIDEILEGLKNVNNLEPVIGEIQTIKDNSWSFVQIDISNAIDAELKYIHLIESFISLKDDFINHLKEWGCSKRNLPTPQIINKFNCLLEHFMAYQDPHNRQERTRQFINDEIIYNLKTLLNENELDKTNVMLNREYEYIIKSKSLHI